MKQQDGGSWSRRRFLAASASATAMAPFTVFAPHAAGAEPAWGDLVGRLVYDGKPPAAKKLVVDKDVECCGKFDIRDESLLVNADGGLKNVFVYLRSAKAAICPELREKAAKQVVLDNRDCIFQPHCMAIWAEPQEFVIVNSDPVAQNVAFAPLGDAQANIIMPVGNKATHRFRRKQTFPVPIACNYHPWESAYILPRDNPYVAISAADGSFAIRQLPAGTWEFQVWHEITGPLETATWPAGRFTATITAGKTDLGTIKLSPSLWAKEKK